jgi:hypothetical protein
MALAALSIFATVQLISSKDTHETIKILQDGIFGNVGNRIVIGRDFSLIPCIEAPASISKEVVAAPPVEFTSPPMFSMTL